MTFCMIVQLWNTNTQAIVSCDADQTENYMYISMKFRTGVQVFCWEVGVFNRSSFQSVSYKQQFVSILVYPPSPVQLQLNVFSFRYKPVITLLFTNSHLWKFLFFGQYQMTTTRCIVHFFPTVIQIYYSTGYKYT